jgi:hypothetical protein
MPTGPLALPAAARHHHQRDTLTPLCSEDFITSASNDLLQRLTGGERQKLHLNTLGTTSSIAVTHVYAFDGVRPVLDPLARCIRACLEASGVQRELKDVQVIVGKRVALATSLPSPARRIVLRDMTALKKFSAKDTFGNVVTLPGSFDVFMCSFPLCSQQASSNYFEVQPLVDMLQCLTVRPSRFLICDHVSIPGLAQYAMYVLLLLSTVRDVVFSSKGSRAPHRGPFL